MNVAKIVKDGIDQYTKGNYKTALEMYKKTLNKAHYTDLGAIYYNIGLCHFSMYNYKAAEVSFSKAFGTYNYLHCGYELCMSKLFNGKLVEGMELYKYRYYGERAHFPNLPIFHALTLEECIGKRVLVLNEEGFGDGIMFSRALHPLSKNAINISYQTCEKMKPLLEKVLQFDNVTYFTDMSLSVEFVMSFDCWIAAGDLFSDHLIKNGMVHTPYKTSNTTDQTLDIGITWSANVLSKSYKERSLKADDFQNALVGDNTSITSLQFGESLDWMETRDISDFEKTFSVMEKQDIIVTVDTVTAHLSGMMNKPTILVYDKYLDWRWNYKLYNNVEIVHISDLKTHMDNVRKDFF